MIWYAAPTLRETLRVTVVTSRTDLGAARDRVPRRVRPLYLRLLGQLLASWFFYIIARG